MRIEIKTPFHEIMIELGLTLFVMRLPVARTLTVALELEGRATASGAVHL
jgi:hypothetical protein